MHLSLGPARGHKWGRSQRQWVPCEDLTPALVLCSPSPTRAQLQAETAPHAPRASSPHGVLHAWQLALGYPKPTQIVPAAHGGLSPHMGVHVFATGSHMVFLPHPGEQRVSKQPMVPH